MKTLYITETGTILLDNDTKDVTDFYSTRNSINDIYAVKEDMHIVVNNYRGTNKKYELDAVAGDIIVSFYEQSFPNKVIVIKSKEWFDNLIAYETLVNKNKQNNCNKCDGDCELDCTCSPC